MNEAASAASPLQALVAVRDEITVMTNVNPRQGLDMRRVIHPLTKDGRLANSATIALEEIASLEAAILEPGTEDIDTARRRCLLALDALIGQISA